jgi:hypothetical protein
MVVMSDCAITAHALLPPAQAQAAVLSWLDELGLVLAYAEDNLLIAWIDDAIDPAEEGCAGAPHLVLEARIHPLAEGVQVRCRLRHGEGPGEALLAAETIRALALCLAGDRRWVVDGREGPRP